METGNCHCHIMVGAQPSKFATSKRSSSTTTPKKTKNHNTAASFKNKDEFQIHILEHLDTKPVQTTKSSRKKKSVKIKLLSDLSDSSSENNIGLTSDSSEASDSELPSLNGRMSKLAKGNTRSAKTTALQDVMLNKIIYEAIDEAQNGTSQQQQQQQHQLDQSMVDSIINFLKFISPNIVGVISNQKSPKLTNASPSSPTDENNPFFRNFFLLDDNVVKLDEPKRKLVRDVLSQTSQSSQSSSNRTNNLNLIKLFLFLFGNFCQDQQNDHNTNSQNGQMFNNMLNVFFNFMEYFYGYVNYQDNLPSTDSNTNNSDQKPNINNNNATKIEETLLSQSKLETQESSSSDASPIVGKNDAPKVDLKETKKADERSNKQESELKTTLTEKKPTSSGNGTLTTTTTTSVISNQPVSVKCTNCCQLTTTSELNDFKTQISNRINTKLKHKCFEFQKEIERLNRTVVDLQAKLSTETISRELIIVKLKYYQKLKSFYKLHKGKKGLETPTTNNNSSMNPYEFETQLRNSSFQVE